MGNQNPTTYQDIESALAGLDPWRANNRAEWIRIGQALHAWDSGHAGLDLWIRWSMISPKFKAGECEAKWRTFRPEKGVTIASLFGAAQEDGWKKAGAQDHPAGRRMLPEAPPHKNGNDSASTTNGSPKARPGKSKMTAEQAAEAFEKLPLARDDETAPAFLKDEYGLNPDTLNDDWRVYVHKTHGPGIAYRAFDPQGRLAAIKFKSFKRNGKGKRETAFLWGDGRGAMVFPGEDAGAPWVVVGGEEKGAAAAMAEFSALALMTGEKAPAEEWISWIVAQNPPWVIFANDADEPGRKANEEGAAALERAGFPADRIFLVWWPAGYDELGGDLKIS